MKFSKTAFGAYHQGGHGSLCYLLCDNADPELYSKVKAEVIAGADKSLEIYENDGVKLALLNYTYDTNGIKLPDDKEYLVELIDEDNIESDAEYAEENSDFTIAFMHWGIEYERKPNREQRRLAAFLHRNGATVIIGHHPHTIQPYEADSARVCFYSLGNFVSNQRKRYCDGGIMAEVEVEKRSAGALRYSLCVTPVWVSVPGYRVLPPEVAAKIIGKGQQRADYEQFMYDTERLFVEGVKPL